MASTQGGCVVLLDVICGGVMAKSSTLLEVVALLREKKAWWLFPIITVFLLLGVLLVATSGSALSPFIYALF